METTLTKTCDNYMNLMFKFCLIVHFQIFPQFDKRIKKISEILLSKNNKALFSYPYTLKFTLNDFILIYYWIQPSNMETTVNTKCENCCRETFKFRMTVNF